MADKDKTQKQLITELTQIHQRIAALEKSEREHEKVEAALRAERDNARQYLDIAEVILVVLDKKGTITFINRKGSHILGYKEGDLIGKNWFTTCLPSHLRNKVKDFLKKLMAGEEKQSEFYENPVLTKPGVERIIAWHSTVLKDVQGTIIGTLSSGEDITERKQAEEALRESDKLNASLLYDSPHPIIVTNPDTSIRYVNNALEKLTGFSATELVGKKAPYPWWTEETVCKTRDDLIKGMRNGAQGMEEHFQKKTGERFVVEITSRSIIHEGILRFFLANWIDVTERKRTEEALRESAEKYRAITRGVMEGFAELDREGRFVDVNEESCRLSGYSKDEHLTLSVLDTEAAETPDEIKKRLQKIIKTGSDRFETRLRRKDGRIIDIELSSTYFPQTGHVLIFHRDITERKRAEQELRRNYQQMQEMLVTTVKALASTVEMKDQYTAGHQPRVTELACAIAEEMGLPEERIEGIRMAGIVHDIGKIMVPAEILNKPGPLTDIQYEMVKMHPRAGFDILKGIKFPWPVAEIVLQHQELMDGSGYPQGLSGEEIILEARILTVANVVEAMVSHRPYRAAYDIQEALAEITKNKGIFYDTLVVDACLKLFAERRFTFD